MKPQPRSRPWLVELWVEKHGKWWLLDQFGTESGAIARVQDIVLSRSKGRDDADANDLRIRFDPTPE